LNRSRQVRIEEALEAAVSDDPGRVVDWLADVLDWLREPMTAMPINRILERLRGAFLVNVVSWTAQEGPVMTEMILDPPDAMTSHTATMAEFQSGMHRDCHPLSAWYDRTRSTDPQTSDRVPFGLVPEARRSILVAPLAELGLEQQMAIYYRRQGVSGCFFVVARDRRDFETGDLVLARYVQRSLVTLDRQTCALRGREQADDAPPDLGLTGRQIAVLQLLSDGLSTRESARRLACSPRTIEKHLQHAYRKLGVRDRVNAIRVTRLARAVVERDPAEPVPVA
jgi:DNA-binding CsgD family transcriptional regulator